MKKIKFDKDRVKEILKTKWKWFLLEIIILAGAIALDLTMKDYLLKFLQSNTADNVFTLIPGFLDLRYTENTGAGFGTLQGNTVLLAVITGIVIFVIFAFLIFYHKEGEMLRIPLVFIAAGGIGNLVDRIALKYVRDFFEFTFVDFAIFNIADAFVTVGAILLVIALFVMLIKEGKKNKKKYDETLAAAVAANSSEAVSDTAQPEQNGLLTEDEHSNPQKNSVGATSGMSDGFDVDTPYNSTSDEYAEQNGNSDENDEKYNNSGENDEQNDNLDTVNKLQVDKNKNFNIETAEKVSAVKKTVTPGEDK